MPRRRRKACIAPGAWLGWRLFSGRARRDPMPRRPPVRRGSVVTRP